MLWTRMVVTVPVDTAVLGDVVVIAVLVDHVAGFGVAGFRGEKYRRKQGKGEEWGISTKLLVFSSRGGLLLLNKPLGYHDGAATSFQRR